VRWDNGTGNSDDGEQDNKGVDESSTPSPLFSRDSWIA
jgi:hypothetical protein